MTAGPDRISIEAMLASRPARLGETKLVGIDGHGGAGKSTLAQLLGRRVGAEVVHTDDFAGWDNPKEWWPLLIERVLEPVAAGATTLDYPRSRWWPDHHPEPVTGQPVTGVLILEGVSALRREFRPYLTLGVFVAAPRHVCLERGLRRDAGQGTEDEIVARWERWFEDEEGYIRRDDPAGHADVVLDGTEPFDRQLSLPPPAPAARQRRPRRGSEE